MTAPEFEEMIPLAALGKLTAKEQAAFEIAMAEDPGLATALREHEEIVAGLWQSAAPLRTMPRSVWGEVKKEINSPVPVNFSRSVFVSSLGWAAALIVAMLWFFNAQQSSSTAQEPVTVSPPIEKTTKPSLSNRVVLTRPSDPAQRQIFELRERLRVFQNENSAATAVPRIIALRHPDSPVLDDSKTQAQRLMNLLTAALQDDLQRLHEEKVDFIIEEGWPENGLSLSPEAVVRHREFPVDRAAELSLGVSAENHYFDFASSILWKPAPDGGGFLGQLVPPDFDLSAFQSPPVSEPEENPTLESHFANASLPEGYVISAGDRSASPAFVFNNFTSDSATVSLRQGSSVVPLQGGIQTGSTSNTSSGPLIYNIPLGNSGDFNWSTPFEVIDTSATGVERVILTNER